MRGKDLLECMEHIDDALIEEALHPVIAPRQHIRTARWGMAAAACLWQGYPQRRSGHTGISGKMIPEALIMRSQCQ